LGWWGCGGFDDGGGETQLAEGGPSSSTGRRSAIDRRKVRRTRRCSETQLADRVAGPELNEALKMARACDHEVRATYSSDRPRAERNFASGSASDAPHSAAWECDRFVNCASGASGFLHVDRKFSEHRSESYVRPEEDLIRALARALQHARHPPLSTRSPLAAARVYLRVAHGGRCPRCRGQARAVDGRSGRCTRGHAFSLTRGTPLQRTKISLPHWLAAVWHLHVDREAISAKTFSVRHTLRHVTAWSLLHRVRRAFIAATPRERGAAAPVAHRINARVVSASRDQGALVLVDVVLVGRPGGRSHARESSLFLGRLRATLTHVYCGVRDRYLALYLAEFAARFGRQQA